MYDLQWWLNMKKVVFFFQTVPLCETTLKKEFIRWYFIKSINFVETPIPLSLLISVLCGGGS